MLKIALHYGKFGILILLVLVGLYLFPVGDYIGENDNPVNNTTVNGDYDFQIDLLENDKIVVEQTEGPDSSQLVLIANYESSSQTQHSISTSSNGSLEIIDVTSVTGLTEVTISDAGTEVYSQTFDSNPEDIGLEIVDIPDKEVTIGEGITLNAESYADNPSNQAEITWDMDDGTSYQQRLINHTYDKVGVYTVNLVIEENGEIGSQSFNITARLPDPIDEIVAPKKVTVGEEVTFNGEESTTSSVSEYEWSIDGKRYTEKNPTVVFDEPGSYTVTLSAVNSAGEFELETMRILVQDS